MARSGLNVEDFLLAAGLYGIPIVFLLGIFFAASARFRAGWSSDRSLFILAPGMVYGFLESTFSRQNWNFLIVDLILLGGATTLLALHILIPKLNRTGLVVLNGLAILLWLFIPRANLKLF